MNNKTWIALGTALFLGAATSPAIVVDLGLNTSYSGGTPSSPATPWLTAQLSDAGANTVNLRLSAVNLAAGEFVSDWLFNLNPSLDPSDLSFSVVSKTGNFWNPEISSVNQNAERAGGGLRFDFGFEFATSGSSSGFRRFTDNDEITFAITGLSGLSVSDFLYRSANGSYGPYTTAAHVQGIDAFLCGDSSAWLGDGSNPPAPVPEPATVIGGCLLLGVLAFRERRRVATLFEKPTA